MPRREVHARGTMHAQVVYVLGTCGCPRGMHTMHTHPTPVNRMTDACEYITLPQTSFEGGTLEQFASSWFSDLLLQYSEITAVPSGCVAKNILYCIVMLNANTGENNHAQKLAIRNITRQLYRLYLSERHLKY